MEQEHHEHHERRLSEHEGKIASLITAVESLVGSFKSDRDQRSAADDTQREEMRILTKAINDTNKFPIAPALTGITIILVMIGGFYALLSQNDTRIEHMAENTDLRMEKRSIDSDEFIRQRVESGWEKLIQHTSDGHPAVQTSRLDKQAEDIKRIEGISVTKGKLASELKAINKSLESLKSDYEIARLWIDRHDQVVPVLNATQNTKDDNFERQLKELMDRNIEYRKVTKSELNKLHQLIGDLYKSGK